MFDNGRTEAEARQGERAVTFDDLIGPLLDREKGYVDHASDRGGPTNMGITQRTYTMWCNDNGGMNRDIRGITRPEAAAIYKANYWIPARCSELPESVREIHFDSSVNHGVSRAAKLLQAAAGVEQDGAIGDKTLAAVAEMDARLLKARYINARYDFYGAIIQRDRSQLVFIAGWLARMSHFV